MRTTLDLPAPLLKEAMHATRAKTKKGVIIQALKDLVKKNKILELKRYQGSVNLNMNMDAIRKRK